MPNSFELITFHVSEFVSQDVFGRWNFIGVYTDGAEYSDHLPEIMQPFYFSFVLEPRVKSFPVIMRISSPSGAELFTANNEINGNMEPTAGSRFVWVVQVPPGIPLKESGDYIIDLGDTIEEFSFSKRFPIRAKGSVLTPSETLPVQGQV